MNKQRTFPRALSLITLATSVFVGACALGPTPEETLEKAASALHSADEGALRAYVNTDSLISQTAVHLGKAAAAQNPLAGLFGGFAQSTAEQMLHSQWDDALRRLRENAKLAKPRTNTATLFGDSASFDGFGKTTENGDVATIEVRFTLMEKGKRKPLTLLVEMTRQNKAWRISALPNLVESLLSKS